MSISDPRWLYPAFIANIIILVPVCWSMFFSAGTGGVTSSLVPGADGLRLLVASLWTAILIASIAGLFAPAFFAPIVLVQIVYKTIWLITFVLPLWRAGEPYPVGVAVVFLIIVLSYPVLFFLAARSP